MNRSQLIEIVAQDADISMKQATRAVGSVLDNIESAMRRGDDVVLMGFGTFKSVIRDTRTGRNPRDGTPAVIEAHRAPRFKPSPKLKAAIN